jgi:hypothetical protein
MVTEQSNLLLDYVGKFINQTLADTNPAIVKSSELQSSISNECTTTKFIDVEECLPHINYLDNTKRKLSGLGKALELITNYFTKAKAKCDNVVNKHRCEKLIVS